MDNSHFKDIRDMKDLEAQVFHFSLEEKELPSLLPERPGVYLFMDAKGTVVYVSKAKSLKKRLLSYLKPGRMTSGKTSFMLARAKDLEIITTATEQEAFLLESNLIKKHMPRYNVVLRDDKRYPALALDVQTAYPRVRIVRRIKKDGSLYFGPFSSAAAVRGTLKALDRIFPIRKCKGDAPKKRARPCINFEMGRCLGPCAMDVPIAVYAEVVEKVKLFLEGRKKDLIKALQSEMEKAAESLDFERAARLRDQIHAISQTSERQDVSSPTLMDEDVIALASEGSAVQIAMLSVRKGSVVGSRSYRIKNPAQSEKEALESFVKQFYKDAPFIPPRILVSMPLDEATSISEWFSALAGKKVRIINPLRGEGRRLTAMALANAKGMLAAGRESIENEGLQQLREILNLKDTPSDLEAVDISTLAGRQAVGAIVSLRDGRKNLGGYRNYKIKTVEGVDDYAMMAEVIKRRLKDGPMPDVLIVDGGRGHLETVGRVIREAGVEPPGLIAVAKPDADEKDAKVYLLGRKNPLAIDPRCAAMMLLLRMRDEVHRRAVSFHRALRAKKLRESELDLIPGLGPKRKRILLTAFGSARAVFDADEQSVQGLPGIGKHVAERIKQYAHMKGLHRE
jgi:excinuclease ABC subunit C